MPLPDPIWIYFIQLGHVAGFKQKEANVKYARTHLKICTEITLAQTRSYFE